METSGAAMRRVDLLLICPFWSAPTGAISWRLVQQAMRSMTNERHGNSILNNEQHLFTSVWNAKMLGKG
jgi:hypothetical protein